MRGACAIAKKLCATESPLTSTTLQTDSKSELFWERVKSQAHNQEAFNHFSTTNRQTDTDLTMDASLKDFMDAETA